MTHFFSRITQAITSTEFYKSVLNEPMSETLKFYAGFLALLTTIVTLAYWLLAYPILKSTMDSVYAQVLQAYPEDLTITWQNETLLTSSDVLIPFPSEYPWFLSREGEYVAAVVTSEDLPEVSTRFVVTPTKIHLMEQGKSVSQQSLSGFLPMDGFVIDRETLPATLSELKPFIASLLIIAGVVLPVLIFIGLILTRAYLLVLEAGLGYVMMRLLGGTLPLSKVVQLALNIFIPAELVTFAVMISQVDMPFSMFSLTFWAYFIVVLLSMRSQRNRY